MFLVQKKVRNFFLVFLLFISLFGESASADILSHLILQAEQHLRLISYFRMGASEEERRHALSINGHLQKTELFFRGARQVLMELKQNSIAYLDPLNVQKWNELVVKSLRRCSSALHPTHTSSGRLPGLSIMGGPEFVDLFLDESEARTSFVVAQNALLSFTQENRNQWVNLLSQLYPLPTIPGERDEQRTATRFDQAIKDSTHLPQLKWLLRSLDKGEANWDFRLDIVLPILETDEQYKFWAALDTPRIGAAKIGNGFLRFRIPPSRWGEFSSSQTLDENFLNYREKIRRINLSIHSETPSKVIEVLSTHPFFQRIGFDQTILESIAKLTDGAAFLQETMNHASDGMEISRYTSHYYHSNLGHYSPLHGEKVIESESYYVEFLNNGVKKLKNCHYLVSNHYKSSI